MQTKFRSNNFRKQLAALSASVFILFALDAGAAQSPDGNWKEVSQFAQPPGQAKQAIKRNKERIPRQYRKLELNVHALEALLRRAPDENSTKKNNVTLTLPMSNGGYQEFVIYSTEMLDPGLASKFPELRTFTGTGMDNPSATLRISWTPRGIEIIVLGTEDDFFIEPFEPGSTSPNYMLFKSKDVPRGVQPEEVPDYSPTLGSLAAMDTPPIAADVSTGSSWRTYDLAVTTSQEYYTNNGGTDPLVMAAITNRVNQLNAIYERELAVRFNLVAGTDQLLNKPYNDGGQNIECNGNPNITDDIDATIGSGSYDIGHLFLWSYGGGVAYVGVVCNSGCKADGQTGVNAAVDVLAHEIGHQFSMRHTYNKCSSYASTTSSAYEPGSGNTLMSYAGVCGSDNIPGDYMQFHVHSYEQAEDYIGVFGSCASLTPSGNSPPVVNAGSAGITIPASTPFALEGSATDPDGDGLSYSWEGHTLGPSTPPNSGTAPFFRVFEPVTEPIRYFPQMSDIVNGIESQGEELPSDNQNLEFRLHVYDGQGGVSYDEPNTQVTVDGTAGPFAVLTPNSNSVTWIPGNSESVTWNVANTGNGTAVDCDNVAIDLSQDGGYTYPISLSASTPNDGAHNVTPPDITTAAARVRVRCADLPDHFFFDISDASFQVNANPGAGECSSGANVIVNSPADVTANDDQCTLREAVDAVNSGGTIEFEAGLVNGTVILGSEITIDKNLTIEGGDRNITVSGNDNSRIFYIYLSGGRINVTLRDLTLTRGFTTSTGGAIRSVHEVLTLERMTFTQSAADDGGAVHHSGSSSAPLTVTDCTFDSNHANFMGGALRVSGNSGAPSYIRNSTFVNNEAWMYSNSVGGAIGIWDGNLTVVNSTFSENRSSGIGGAIGDYQDNNTVFTVRNSTFIDNFANNPYHGNLPGSSIYHYSTNGAFHLSNSILAGTHGNECYTPRSPLDTKVNNLVEDGSCEPTYTGDPMVDNLASNGGPTQTMGLLTGSPALNAGTSCEQYDQRGYTRKAACDLGAWENMGCVAGPFHVPHNEWHIISMPCDAGPNNQISQVLGDDLNGTYAVDWGVYAFDAAGGWRGRFTFLPESAPLIPGNGYWLLHMNGPESWSMKLTDAQNTEPFEIPLTAAHSGNDMQQNLVGNPTGRTLPWDEVIVEDSLGNCFENPSQAAAAGPPSLIENSVNWYNGSGYTVCDDTGTNAPCEFNPGQGFWVDVPDNGETELKLIVGGACVAGDGAAARPSGDKAPRAAAPEGWSVQIRVVSGELEDPANTLGQREGAEFGPDRNDLLELEPDRMPWMTLVFPHDDWNEDSGDYGADYQPLDKKSGGEWNFVIRTSEDLEDLTLTWQASEDILRRSTLVDLDTGETIKLKKLWNHTTDWYGLKERHFTWRLK